MPSWFQQLKIESRGSSNLTHCEHLSFHRPLTHICEHILQQMRSHGKSCEFSYLSTVVDHWSEAIPFSGNFTEECCRTFNLHWLLILEFPWTSHRITDGNLSHLWFILACSLISTLHSTLAHHPDQTGWIDHLPCILLSLCTLPIPDLHDSPASLIFHNHQLLTILMVAPA